MTRKLTAAYDRPANTSEADHFTLHPSPFGTGVNQQARHRNGTQKGEAWRVKSEE